MFYYVIFRVLREHMSNLSKNLVPTHNDLRIPKVCSHLLEIKLLKIKIQ